MCEDMSYLALIRKLVISHCHAVLHGVWLVVNDILCFSHRREWFVREWLAVTAKQSGVI